ncbi:MAG: biosynthetic-type acetolactate synthase large subunit [Eubacteriales bacterium]
MNGAQTIIKFLEDKKAEAIFGYPGGAVLTLYDALYDSSLNHILTRHEQGAIHAAEGYARSTGRTGVVFATSGPGATNLITGLSDANLDSVPLFVITGQVVAPSIGTDAFQEADMRGITIPVTKHNYLVSKASDLPSILEEAWRIAESGRPGPVLIDVPKNIFAAEIPDGTPVDVKLPRVRRRQFTLEEQLSGISEALRHSYRPLILAGGGITISHGGKQALHAFIEKFNIPCAVTLMGKANITEEHPLALGMAGMHGMPAANTAMSKCDLVIAVGVRFSDRTVGNPKVFERARTIIHVDLDVAEINKNVKVNIPVVCDAAQFLNTLAGLDISDEKKREWKSWCEELAPVRQKYNILPVEKGMGNGKLRARNIIRAVCHADDKAVFVTDVGQHQMLAAQEIRAKLERSFITSGGQGTMGFGLPAAIGASFGREDAQVVLFTGDGGVQMNIQELAIAKRSGRPIKIFILDNNRLGMVRQWQQHFYNSHFSQTILDDNPDFVMLASAYRIPAVRIETWEDFEQKLPGIMSDKGAMVIHCLTDPDENVYPIIPSGKSNNEMMMEEDGK